MKIARATALAAFLVSASAFSPAFVSNSAANRLSATVVEEAASDVAADELKKKLQPTRFDRLKELYKGPRFTLTDEEISFSYDDFAKAVDETEYGFERNKIVQGTVVEYSNGGCLVDIGAKASAFLPDQEASLDMELEIEDAVPLDTPLDFQIISDEDENGQLLVSIKRIEYKRAWERVTEMSQEDVVLEAPVVAVNRGGAICMVEGLRAFLPGSHLAGLMPDEDLIGQTLKVKFLEVNNENNKLVVSNRRAVVEQQMADLSRGDVVTGVVKALKVYGAFVDVGGMSGLLHISQISSDRITDLETVLQPGQQIKCMIIDHDKVNGRIALSTKYLEPQGGDMIDNPQKVFDMADQMAERYHAQKEKERESREATARNIVMGLGSALDGELSDDDDKADPLQDVSDSLDSLLTE